MLSLVIFPTATDTISQASAYANPWIAEFYPLIYLSIGVFTMAILIRWLISVLTDAIAHAFQPKQKMNWLNTSEGQYQAQRYGGHNPFMN